MASANWVGPEGVREGGGPGGKRGKGKVGDARETGKRPRRNRAKARRRTLLTKTQETGKGQSRLLRGPWGGLEGETLGRSGKGLGAKTRRTFESKTLSLRVGWVLRALGEGCCGGGGSSAKQIRTHFLCKLGFGGAQADRQSSREAFGRVWGGWRGGGPRDRQRPGMLLGSRGRFRASRLAEAKAAFRRLWGGLEGDVCGVGRPGGKHGLHCAHAASSRGWRIMPARIGRVSMLLNLQTCSSLVGLDAGLRFN